MKKRVREKLMKRVLAYVRVVFLAIILLAIVKLPVMAAPANVIADTSLDVSWLTTGETNENIDKGTEIIKKIGEIILIFMMFVGGIVAVICLMGVKNGNVNMDLKVVWALAGVAIVLMIIAIIIP